MTDDLHDTQAACPDAHRREQAQLQEELSRASADAAQQERELERQEVRLSSSRARLDALAGAGRRLPLLDRARIASPCPVRWEEMVGDERTRFCARCSKTVYNLSEMTRLEAEALLLASASIHVCGSAAGRNEIGDGLRAGTLLERLFEDGGDVLGALVVVLTDATQPSRPASRAEMLGALASEAHRAAWELVAREGLSSVKDFYPEEPALWVLHSPLMIDHFSEPPSRQSP